MILKRIDHWDTRALDVFLRQRAGAAFVWGKHDCALLAADAVLAMTGVDIAAEFRGKYADEAGALATIKAVCGGSTVADAAAWCAQQYGLREWMYPLHARRGDLVIARQPDGSLIAGVVHLNGRHVVAAGGTELLRLPLRSIQRSWHVGPVEDMRGLYV